MGNTSLLKLGSVTKNRHEIFSWSIFQFQRICQLNRFFKIKIFKNFFNKCFVKRKKNLLGAI